MWREGVGHVIASLVRGMPRQRYHSTVWCLEERNIVGQRLRHEGYEVVEFNKRCHRDVALFIRLATLVRRQRIDILHCHNELSWFYGALGGRLGGVPRLLMTLHGRRADMSPRHLWEQRRLASLTTAVVSVSAYLRQQAISDMGLWPPKVVTIRNGIPLPPQDYDGVQRRQARELLGMPETAIVVGSVGWMTAVKNHDLLIEAAAETRAVVPGLRVVLIGDGPIRQRLTHKVAALGLRDCVMFTGLRDDVTALLPGLDMYVCSSDYEGISLSVLEAMAAARAVIATAVGGNPEIIQHQKTGFLVDKGNRQALSSAIIELAGNAARRCALAQHARRAVERQYSLARMVQDYDQLYQWCLLPRRWRAQSPKV
jgi:glycosyltransferase involved in cell wall biosynthesis